MIKIVFLLVLTPPTEFRETLHAWQIKQFPLSYFSAFNSQLVSQEFRKGNKLFHFNLAKQ